MAFSAPIRQHDSAFAPGADAARPVLAERYKTKICMNYVQTGVCPYEVRCMFAHGDAELRTKDMNLRDGLVTEGAIHKFRRQAARAKKAASASSSQVILPSQTSHADSRSSFEEKPLWFASPATASYVRTTDGTLIHDPYGWMAITPSITCDCNDCIRHPDDAFGESCQECDEHPLGGTTCWPDRRRSPSSSCDCSQCLPHFGGDCEECAQQFNHSGSAATEYHDYASMP